ncbi:hypothetical protein CK203_000158 [Vitis vinifera]|uniref:Uncharacterized protein n=1 Tax=Vitis vinifera TaxID=29760 RepID=A0A438KRR5_VITVI|nr:hypothetical protein CK203_000158 [Vitis vinifera]
MLIRFQFSHVMDAEGALQLILGWNNSPSKGAYTTSSTPSKRRFPKDMSYVKGVSMFPSDVPSSVVTKSFMLVELRLGLKEQSMFLRVKNGPNASKAILAIHGRNTVVTMFLAKKGKGYITKWNLKHQKFEGHSLIFLQNILHLGDLLGKTAIWEGGRTWRSEKDLERECVREMEKKAGTGWEQDAAGFIQSGVEEGVWGRIENFEAWLSASRIRGPDIGKILAREWENLLFNARRKQGGMLPTPGCHGREKKRFNILYPKAKEQKGVGPFGEALHEMEPGSDGQKDSKIRRSFGVPCWEILRGGGEAECRVEKRWCG